MTEQEKIGATEETRESRRQLLLKGVLAAAAVAILVVALVVVEGSHEPEPAPTARTVTSTGVVQQGSDAQSGSLAEAAMQALKNSSEAAELQSIVMAEQQATASAAATAPVVPEESAEPLGVPPNVTPAASEPQVTGTRRRESAGRLVLEQSPPKGSHASVSSSAASSVKALVLPPRTTAATVTASAASSAAKQGEFFVQVGVFSNPGNAEELRVKLKAAGIPTQVETRVQIGPFTSRQEAAAAQTKLKALGLDGGMVVPARH